MSEAKRLDGTLCCRISYCYQYLFEVDSATRLTYCSVANLLLLCSCLFQEQC
uniref:Uncharacterized protein n=1 Tax=Anguilla anguilla TaxID=7936 RepID=A0A0E9Q2Q7_ANGAN